MDLSIVFYAALAGAVVTALAAVAVPPARKRLLLVAAALFAVDGVLGLLTIGVVFLGLAVLCLALAMRTQPGAPTRPA